MLGHCPDCNASGPCFHRNGTSAPEAEQTLLKLVENNPDLDAELLESLQSSLEATPSEPELTAPSAEVVDSEPVESLDSAPFTCGPEPSPLPAAPVVPEPTSHREASPRKTWRDALRDRLATTARGSSFGSDTRRLADTPPRNPSVALANTNIGTLWESVQWTGLEGIVVGLVLLAACCVTGLFVTGELPRLPMEAQAKGLFVVVVSLTAVLYGGVRFLNRKRMVPQLERLGLSLALLQAPIATFAAAQVLALNWTTGAVLALIAIAVQAAVQRRLALVFLPSLRPFLLGHGLLPLVWILLAPTGGLLTTVAATGGAFTFVWLLTVIRQQLARHEETVESRGLMVLWQVWLMVITMVTCSVTMLERPWAGLAPWGALLVATSVALLRSPQLRHWRLRGSSAPTTPVAAALLAAAGTGLSFASPGLFLVGSCTTAWILFTAAGTLRKPALVVPAIALGMAAYGLLPIPLSLAAALLTGEELALSLDSPWQLFLDLDAAFFVLYFAATMALFTRERRRWTDRARVLEFTLVPFAILLLGKASILDSSLRSAGMTAAGLGLCFLIGGIAGRHRGFVITGLIGALAGTACLLLALGVLPVDVSLFESTPPTP